jgi:hypothetical protein
VTRSVLDFSLSPLHPRGRCTDTRVSRYRYDVSRTIIAAGDFECNLENTVLDIALEIASGTVFEQTLFTPDL